jgi:hypothetical protein
MPCAGIGDHKSHSLPKERYMKASTAIVATLLGLSVGLTACKKKDETPIEKMSESVQDGLNMRDNEKMKDAGEDAADAMKNAGEAVKEGAEDMKKEVTN